MHPITAVVLTVTALAGGVVVYKKCEPKPPEAGSFESLAPDITKMRREGAGNKADEATQRERKKRLDRWKASGVITSVPEPGDGITQRQTGEPGHVSIQRLTVAPGFFLLDFLEKQEVAALAFVYLHQIAEGTPVHFLRYDRLILVDNLNNHEVGTVSFAGGLGSTLTMHR